MPPSRNTVSSSSPIFHVWRFTESTIRAGRNALYPFICSRLFSAATNFCGVTTYRHKRCTTETRSKVEDLLKTGGLKALQDEVQRLDPEYYAIVDQQNPRRLQRALEVCYQTGKTFTSFRSGNGVQRDFDIKKYALLWDRQELIERIDKRVDLMMKQGLLEEAKALYPKRHLNALNTVGYKELFAYFDGQCTLDEAVEQIKIHTRQYAKRQMTWLRKDSNYQWIMPEDFDSTVSALRQALA